MHIKQCYFFWLQWGLFDRQFGRSDTQEPDPEGRVPQWEKASVQEMKDKFSAIGLGPRQVYNSSRLFGKHCILDLSFQDSSQATKLLIIVQTVAFLRTLVI